MSQRFSLYTAGESWLHRMDPRAKLWCAVLAATAAFICRHVLVLAALLVLIHLALLRARIPAARLGWLWKRLAPLLAMIVVLQPIFVPGSGAEWVRIGALRITGSGVLDGMSLALRTSALAFAAVTYLLTTDPAQLVEGLVRLGLPYAGGLTVGLAIRYLPTAYGLFVSITEAQQARGLILTKGNLFRRARAYLPILVATVIAALRFSDNLGLALAARGLGFQRRRTSLHRIRFRPEDWWAVAAAGAAFAALAVARFGFGFGAGPW